MNTFLFSLMFFIPSLAVCLFFATSFDCRIHCFNYNPHCRVQPSRFALPNDGCTLPPFLFQVHLSVAGWSLDPSHAALARSLRNGERGARHRQSALLGLVAADEAVGVHENAAGNASQRAQLLVANAWWPWMKMRRKKRGLVKLLYCP